MRPIAPQLDEANSKRYRARPGKPKRAVLVWPAASYALSWGAQRFDGPHMRVGDGSEAYGVELRAFFTTHRPLPAQPDHYVKDAVVRGLRVTEDTDLVTVVEGRQEGTSTVKAGGWIVQNPGGEQYYNTPEDFESKYELID